MRTLSTIGGVRLTAARPRQNHWRAQRMAKAKNPTNPAAAKKRGLDLSTEGARTAVGSDAHDVQIELLEQVMAALWRPAWKTDDQKVQAMQAAYETLKKIAPRSELEGMLAVQMIGTHNAAMECLRRAMIESQGMESRDQNLKHAVRLMGLYERQLAALDKHRGKGRQKITVEHVNVHAGGQAIVGDLNTGQAAPPPPAAAQAPAALADDSAADDDGAALARALKAKPAKSPAARRG